MGKAQLGNDGASKRNLKEAMRGIKADNFKPVFLPLGALTNLVKILKGLPK